MTKTEESRSRAVLRAAKTLLLQELDAHIMIRLPAEVRDMLKKRALEKGVKPATLVRQLVYRYLGLIEGES